MDCKPMDDSVLLTAESNSVQRAKLLKFRSKRAHADFVDATDVVFEVVDVIVTDEPVEATSYDDFCNTKASTKRASKELRVMLFGNLLTEPHESICVHVAGYRPWCMVELVNCSDPETAASELIDLICERMYIPRDYVGCEIEFRPKLYGCYTDPEADARGDPITWRKWPMAKISFHNVSLAKAFDRLELDTTKYQHTDTKSGFILKLLCDSSINPAGLVKITKFATRSEREKASYCQWEVDVDLLNVEPLRDPRSVRKVIASLDGEMRSISGLLPRFQNGEYTFCVSSVVWASNQCTPEDEADLWKIVHYVGPVAVPRRVADDPQFVIIICSSPMDLIHQLRDDLIETIDPDVLTGYNIYGFDWPFLFGEYLQNVSPLHMRLTEELDTQLRRHVETFLGLAKTDVHFAVTSFECGEKFLSARRGLWQSVVTMMERDEALGPTFVYNLRNNESVYKYQSRRAQRLILRVVQDLIKLSYARNSSMGARIYEFQLQLERETQMPTGLDLFTKLGAADRETLVSKLPEGLRRLLDQTAATAEFHREYVELTDVSYDVKELLGGDAAAARGKRPFLEAKYSLLGFQKEYPRGLCWSRLRQDPCILKAKIMDTAAKGTNIYEMLASSSTNFSSLAGRMQVDMMQIIKDDKKPRSTSLKNVSEEFLANKKYEKLDMDKHRMFDIVRRGNPVEQFEIVEYCWTDAAIPIWLIRQYLYLFLWTEMGRVCRTPLDAITNGGQQTKVYNNMIFSIRPNAPSDELQGQRPGDAPLPSCGFAVNSPLVTVWPSLDVDALVREHMPSASGAARGKHIKYNVAPEVYANRIAEYEGARVLDPVSGLHRDGITTTFDFASLYPSIHRGFNLCPSTLILDEAELARLVARDDSIVVDDVVDMTVEAIGELFKSYRYVLAKFDINFQLPEVFWDKTASVLRIQHDQKKKIIMHKFTNPVYFLLNLRGVTPRLLESLIVARKSAKKDGEKAEFASKDAEAAGDLDKAQQLKMLAQIQNGRQLALKVSANSVYGFFGVDDQIGKISCKLVAATVTHIGRRMIIKTMRAVESMYPGCKVLYGDTDSVMVKWGSDIRTEKESWDRAYEAAAKLSALFPPPNKLEAEEQKLRAFFSETKKAYAALISTPGKNGTYDHSIKIKGLVLVRRDCIGVLAELMEKCIDELLRSDTDDALFKVLVNTLDDVIHNRVPVEQYVMSKSIALDYANAAVQPHIQARLRMQSRGLEAPPIGARMPYVFVERTNCKNLADSAEHPDIVAMDGLVINRKYYLTNAFMNPLLKILMPTKIDIRKLIEVAVSYLTVQHRTSFVELCNRLCRPSTIARVVPSVDHVVAQPDASVETPQFRRRISALADDDD